MRSPRRSADRGSAALEVTLVLGAIVSVFLGVMQIGLTGMTHTLLAGTAADAARTVAILRDVQAADERIDQIALLPFFSIDKRVITEKWVEGSLQSEVTLIASVPALVPWAGRSLQVTRHSLIEVP